MTMTSNYSKGQRLITLYMSGLLLATTLLSACGEVSTPSAPATTSASTTLPANPTTATAEPLPASLLLGDPGNPWGEITPYKVSGSDSFDTLPLDSNLLQSLNGLFQFAPHLGVNGSFNLFQGTRFRLRINAGISSAFVNGMVSAPGFATGLRYGFPGKGILVSSPKSLTGIGFTPLAIWQLVNAASMLYFIDGINRQLDAINQNILDIKQYLENKDFAQLKGNYDYLTSVQSNLVQQKVSDSDVEAIRQLLETIERESQQALVQYRTGVQLKRNELEALTREKLLFIDKTINKVNFDSVITDYDRAMNSYLSALMVRSLSAQVRCAIPSSRSLALSRLEEVRAGLSDWYTEQNLFNSQVDRKLPLLDGFLSSQSDRNYIIARVNDRAKNAGQIFGQNYVLYSNTIQRLQAQVQEGSTRPLDLIAELDGQGNIKTLSQLR